VSDASLPTCTQCGSELKIRQIVSDPRRNAAVHVYECTQGSKLHYLSKEDASGGLADPRPASVGASPFADGSLAAIGWPWQLPGGMADWLPLSSIPHFKPRAFNKPGLFSLALSV
jgi:hypothetical protein